MVQFQQMPDHVGNTDQFTDIPDVPVDATASRVIPRQVTSGVTRGTQTVVNLDGSYMTLGLIPDGGNDFGIAFFNANGVIISKNTGTVDYMYNSNGVLIFKNTGDVQYNYDTAGNLIFKNDGRTQFVYDATTGKNIMQIGHLPDGTYGMVVAKTGTDVAALFS
jgi:YD repeat-containing protein